MTPKRIPAESPEPSQSRINWELVGKIVVPIVVALVGATGPVWTRLLLPSGPATNPSDPTSTAQPLLGAPTPQRGVTFQDSFSGGALDTTKWVLQNNTAGVGLGSGFMRLSSQGTRYPYIYSRLNPIPLARNFRITTRYKYLSTGTCDATIAMTSFFLPAGLSQDEIIKISANAEAAGMSIWL